MTGSHFSAESLGRSPVPTSLVRLVSPAPGSSDRPPGSAAPHPLPPQRCLARSVLPSGRTREECQEKKSEVLLICISLKETEYKREAFGSSRQLGAGEAAGNRTQQRPLLPAVSGVSRTRGSTRLCLKSKVPMLQMKLNSIQARDVLMCVKEHSDSWWQTRQSPSHLGKGTRARGNSGWLVLNCAATVLLRLLDAGAV